MNYIKKHWSEILLGAFLVLMLLPQIRTPIQVFIQRMIAFSPNVVSTERQELLLDYNLIYENEQLERFNLNKLKGDVIIINFWATWCPPCIAEMPSFQALYKDYQQDVEFLFITNDDWSIIHKFENKRQYNLPYYRLLQTNSRLSSNQLPTSYLIDKNGKIIIEHVGVADWNSTKFRTKLDELIAE